MAQDQTGETRAGAARRQSLSDKAIAVFAFAAHHSLESGEAVRAVVRHDRAGHRADPGAEAELLEAGLATVEGDRLAFTARGLAVLDQAISALRGLAPDPSP